MADKHVPYKFCDAHFKTNCPICFQVAQPNPTNEPAGAPTTPAGPASGVANVPAAVAPPAPAAVLTDPRAQKIVENARKYALAVEAAAIIADQVLQAEELLAGLKKKLAETKKDIEQALEETKKL